MTCEGGVVLVVAHLVSGVLDRVIDPGRGTFRRSQ